MHPKKCNFAVPEVMYLGHILSKNGVSVDKAKIDVVRSYPTPKFVKEVRAFIGYCSFYRRFVLNFAKIAAPLHQLLEKDRVWNWSGECEYAFQTLKGSAMTTILPSSGITQT